MVAQQVLVLFVVVRIRLGQHFLIIQKIYLIVRKSVADDGLFLFFRGRAGRLQRDVQKHANPCHSDI